MYLRRDNQPLCAALAATIISQYGINIWQRTVSNSNMATYRNAASMREIGAAA